MAEYAMSGRTKEMSFCYGILESIVYHSTKNNDEDGRLPSSALLMYTALITALEEWVTEVGKERLTYVSSNGAWQKFENSIDNFWQKRDLRKTGFLKQLLNCLNRKRIWMKKEIPIFGIGWMIVIPQQSRTLQNQQELCLS